MYSTSRHENGKYQNAYGIGYCKYWRNCGPGYGRDDSDIAQSIDHIYDINCTLCKSTGDSLSFNGGTDTSTCQEHSSTCPIGEGLTGHTSTQEGICKRCPTNWYSSQSDNTPCNEKDVSFPGGAGRAWKLKKI